MKALAQPLPPSAPPRWISYRVLFALEPALQRRFYPRPASAA